MNLCKSTRWSNNPYVARVSKFHNSWARIAGSSSAGRAAAPPACIYLTAMTTTNNDVAGDGWTHSRGLQPSCAQNVKKMIDARICDVGFCRTSARTYRPRRCSYRFLHGEEAPPCSNRAAQPLSWPPASQLLQQVGENRPDGSK